MGDTATY